ncbi:beta-1,4-galactosyltransferase 6 isoform X2 [Narcine bancroftii]
MMQAQGKMLRDNVRTIGILIRDRYTKRNNTLNGTDYLEGYNSSEYLGQGGTYLPEDFTYSPGLPCPEKLPSMKGIINVNMSEISMEEIQHVFSQDIEIKSGGHWKPGDCKPRWKVAILIPFRNRHEHLPILFRHLIPMLQRQHVQFGFYVIEQAGNFPFNRAMLFNVGFVEAMKDLEWDCLIFHDVDHIPESDRNYYGCGQMPRHFASKLDKYMYILPYNEFFGGVSGLTVEQFRKINGFPNAFWGWGGEDDDLWRRVLYAGYNVTRPEGDLGKYKSIPHHHRGEVQFLGRTSILAVHPLSSMFWTRSETSHTLAHGRQRTIKVSISPAQSLFRPPHYRIADHSWLLLHLLRHSARLIARDLVTI